MFALIRDLPPIKTSMLVGFEHGRQLEIEALCGAVLRRAERHGIQVPCMSTIATLLAAKVGDGTLKP
jgi:2-dehydropantoate 2-reductase